MTRRRQRQQAEEATRSRRLRPLNPRQAEYLKAIRDHPVTVAYGPAGTGKTYLPAVRAAEMLDRGEVERLIICRPAVAACGEQHGFLPGDIRRKLEPWAAPVVEAVEDSFGSKTKVDQLIKDGVIQTIPFTYLRGRTFRKAFVLLDESQNTTPEQMKLFTTRLGEGVKVVISGDVGQGDIKGDSGLADLLRMVERHDALREFVGVVRFGVEDVERSAICQAFVQAYGG